MRGLTTCVLNLLSNKICSCRLTHFCSSYLPWYVEEGGERRLAAFVLSRIDVNVNVFCFYRSVLSLSLCVFRLSCHHIRWWHFLSSSSVYRLLLINFSLRCHCHLLSLYLLCSVLLRWWCENENLHRRRRDRGWLYVSLSLYFVPKYTCPMYVRTNKIE